MDQTLFDECFGETWERATNLVETDEKERLAVLESQYHVKTWSPHTTATFLLDQRSSSISPTLRDALIKAQCNGIMLNFWASKMQEFRRGLNLVGYRSFVQREIQKLIGIEGMDQREWEELLASAQASTLGNLADPLIGKGYVLEVFTDEDVVALKDAPSSSGPSSSPGSGAVWLEALEEEYGIEGLDYASALKVEEVLQEAKRDAHERSLALVSDFEILADDVNSLHQTLKQERQTEKRRVEAAKVGCELLPAVAKQIMDGELQKAVHLLEEAIDRAREQDGEEGKGLKLLKARSSYQLIVPPESPYEPATRAKSDDADESKADTPGKTGVEDSVGAAALAAPPPRHPNLSSMTSQPVSMSFGADSMLEKYVAKVVCAATAPLDNGQEEGDDDDNRTASDDGEGESKGPATSERRHHGRRHLKPVSPSEGTLADPDATDWAGQFRALMERGRGQGKGEVTEEVARRIANLSQDFVHDVALVGKRIIEEAMLPSYSQMSFKPKGMGGIAGGRKYVQNGVLYKLASAIEADSPYGGSFEAANKAAAHDLRGAIAFSNAVERLRRNGETAAGSKERQLPHVTLCALVDYLGFRLQAQALLPLESGQSLKLGSDDGGDTIHNKDDELFDMFKRVAEELDMAPHGVLVKKDRREKARKEAHLKLMIGAGGRSEDDDLVKAIRGSIAQFDQREVQVPFGADVEGHRDNQGRPVALDFHRVFSPEHILVTDHLHSNEATGSIFVRFLRPELIKRFVQSGRPDAAPPSADALSNFGAGSSSEREMNRRTRAATEFLVGTVVPEAAKELDEYPPGMVTNLPAFLHEKGINIRHLGLVFHHCSSAAARNLLLREMVVRTLKNLMRQGARNVLKHLGRASLSSVKTLYTKVLNLAFHLVGEVEANDFWTVDIWDGLRARFGNRDPALRNTLRRCVLPDRKAVQAMVLRLGNMLGIVFSDDFRETELVSGRGDGGGHSSGGQIFFTSTDIKSLDVHVKYMTVVDRAAGNLLRLEKNEYHGVDACVPTRLAAAAKRRFEAVLASTPSDATAKKAVDELSKLTDYRARIDKLYNAFGKTTQSNLTLQNLHNSAEVGGSQLDLSELDLSDSGAASWWQDLIWLVLSEPKLKSIQTIKVPALGTGVQIGDDGLLSVEDLRVLIRGGGERPGDRDGMPDPGLDAQPRGIRKLVIDSGGSPGEFLGALGRACMLASSSVGHSPVTSTGQDSRLQLATYPIDTIASRPGPGKGLKLDKLCEGIHGWASVQAIKLGTSVWAERSKMSGSIEVASRWLEYGLTELDLSGNSKVGGDLARARLPETLAKLNLEGCKNIGGELSTAQWPSALQELNLQETGVELNFSKTKFPKALRKLELMLCFLHGSLESIEFPAGLEVLRLREDTEQTRKFGKGVEGNLEKIVLPPALVQFICICPRLTGNLAKVNWPPNLKKIDFTGKVEKQRKIHGSLDDCKFPDSLEELCLYRCQKVTGDISAFKIPPNLTRLDLGSVKLLKGDLSKVAWPDSLVDLDLSHCSEVRGTIQREFQKKPKMHGGTRVTFTHHGVTYTPNMGSVASRKRLQSGSA